jgi:hypothetical protein
MPATVWPSSAIHAAVTAPTWPQPTTATLLPSPISFSGHSGLGAIVIVIIGATGPDSTEAGCVDNNARIRQRPKSRICRPTRYGPATFGIRAYRWGVLLHDLPDVRFFHLFGSLNAGYFINNVLPFQMGELARAYLISELDNFSTTRSLSTILVERMVYRRSASPAPR